MINLDAIKAKIKDKNINDYVETYLEISSQYETLESEWIKGNLECEEFNQILYISDFLTEKIAKYYIEKHYTRR